MQYKPETKNVAMMDSAYTPVSKPLSLAEDPQIQRIRKILTIALAVCLVLTVVNLLTGLLGSERTNAKENTRRVTQVGQAFSSILFYGFIYFFARRYSTIGLRVFAWLGVIRLAIIGVAIVLILFFIIVDLTGVTYIPDGQNNDVINDVPPAGAFVFAGVTIAVFVLSVIIVRLNFKLARLIDANKRLAILYI